MLSIKADLNEKLMIKDETVRIAGGVLEVLESGTARLRLPISDIGRAEIEEGVGLGKLLIKMKSGKEVEAAYFTKNRVKMFRKFADAINQYAATGKEVNASFEEKRLEPGGMHTLLWLYGFTSKHKRVLILGLVLSLVMVGLNLVPPYLLKVLIDSVILSSSHNTALFEELTIVLIASYGASALVSAFQNYTLNVSGNSIVRDLKMRLFGHAVRLHAKQIDNITPSRIQSRLISDTDRTQWLMTYGVSTIVTNMLTIVGIGVILFIMFPGLAVYVLIPIPFIILLIMSYNRRADRAYHQEWRKFSDMITKIDDVVPNYAVVKSAAKEGYEERRFGGGLGELYSTQVGIARMEIKYWYPVGFLISMVTVAIWWVGGGLVIAGTIQLGIVTAFLAYMGMFYSPIQQLSYIMPYIQSAITSGERLREVFDSDTPIESPSGKKTPVLAGDITFSNVWFGYDPLFPVIKGISVRMEHGKVTAVVGKSGAGKSTIARLIMGLYSADKGVVAFGKTDINSIDIGYLRSRIAYVPQESTFFDNTIAYNMSYFAENRPAGLMLVAAAKAVEMHDEIMRLPLSYDNRIRGKGLSLSGGQKQRLAVARAMLSEADIVVLDEITANLDVINSRKVNEAVLRLQSDKTIVTITHDVGEITNSDYAIVLKDGIIAEQGSTPALIRKNGELRKMFKYKLEGRIRRKRETGKKLADYLGGIVADEKRISVAQGSRRSFVDVEANGKRIRNLVPRRPFPVSAPNVVLLYTKGEGAKDVLALEDYTRLNDNSRNTLEEAMELSNFNPRVKGIKVIRITGDGLEWKLETDKGGMSVLTRNRNDVLVRHGNIILIDEFNTPLKIAIADLDEKSAKLLNATI